MIWTRVCKGGRWRQIYCDFLPQPILANFRLHLVLKPLLKLIGIHVTNFLGAYSDNGRMLRRWEFLVTRGGAIYSSNMEFLLYPQDIDIYELLPKSIECTNIDVRFDVSVMLLFVCRGRVK